MRLGELLEGIHAGAQAPAPDVEIGGLAYDSRAVAPGDLFFCVRGLRTDGHDFARAAVSAGAAALVVEHQLALGVPEVLVPDARAAMAPLAARFYGEPGRDLRVVGVTGTNGKTTTAYLVRALLEAAGVRCGLLGTVKSVVGGRERVRGDLHRACAVAAVEHRAQIRLQVDRLGGRALDRPLAPADHRLDGA